MPANILPPVRDYYRVEDDDGGRFWLFRDGPMNAAKWEESVRKMMKTYGAPIAEALGLKRDTARRWLPGGVSGPGARTVT